jgi:cyclase
MKKKLFLGANAEIFKNAQALRYNMTVAETALWASLGIIYQTQNSQDNIHLDNI